MARHSIGDIVRYTNKNERLDVFGEIIALWRDPWSHTVSAMIEPLDEKFRHARLFRTTISSTNSEYKFDPNKFEPSGPIRRSNRACIWAPMSSKNLVTGFPPKDYNPSQNGDTDEDI